MIELWAQIRRQWVPIVVLCVMAAGSIIGIRECSSLPRIPFVDPGSLGDQEKLPELFR